MTADQILEVRNLNTTFTARRAGKTYRIRAVDDVSFSVERGEVLGIVGETGCGKTTVGRTIIRLTKPESGHVLFNGQDLLAQRWRELRRTRLKIRMVFQDPYASLDQRRSIADSVAEAGDIHGVFRTAPIARPGLPRP